MRVRAKGAFSAGTEWGRKNMGDRQWAGERGAVEGVRANRREVWMGVRPGQAASGRGCRAQRCTGRAKDVCEGKNQGR